ncbi:MAG: glycosyltransferase [Winogradskyella sp.]|uniref:glycosyltransferase family 2 protein n=1 Tax=Winogradskyella sp. TaxID=1883156 RepID=UPI000F3BE7C8|nr:glycosyltransferase [Winogradskyella sp.]RNC87723.1 MAG: glycosyltransferase [Winogradskyella sp.]
MLFGICFSIICLYLALIAWFNWGFNKVEEFQLQDLKPKTQFTVIIPFRNEAKNLPVLLNAISNLHYPKSHYEIILVNDASEDNSVEIITGFLGKNLSEFNVSIIENHRTSNSPKKDAINTAIYKAKHDWIITTDADCLLPKYWLDSYDEYIQKNEIIAIAGPVRFVGLSSFFNRFQILDTLSLQGVTIAGFGLKHPFMCNGANFAYSKTAFNTVNGFEGNHIIASGDDVFLLQKFKKEYPKKVDFIKSEKATVQAKVADSFESYIQQRIRWASKTKSYDSAITKGIGLLVFLANLIMVILIPLWAFNLLSLKTIGMFYLIKSSIDLLIIFKTARFYQQEPVLLSYVFSSLLYPFITTYIIIVAPFSSYKWKGRIFKN